MEYNREEENTFRTDLFRRMDVQDAILKEIKDQTTKTNGRVTVLEINTKDYEDTKKIVASLSNWKVWLTGACAVIVIGAAGVANIVMRDVYRTAQDNAQEIINKQKADLVEEVVSSINQTYNLKVLKLRNE